MSSAASRPPHSVGQSSPVNQPGRQPVGQPVASASGDGLRQPPSRPQLMGPPARPTPPVAPPAPVETKTAPPPPPEPETPQKIGPISPPSERMQYRAIGLLKGKYVASEEQFNRGNIAVTDGTLIDSVLLGRVTSLIKKHIDLETEHIWVVYPRTLYSEENQPALHMQIVGVWEPETLNARNSEDADEVKDSEEGPQYLSTEEATEQCDAFSVRGEVAKYTEDKNEIVINIVQKSKSETVKPKRPFKLLINGQLEGRSTGYFWDLKVEREEGQLMLKEATQIAVVPPKKKSKNARKGGARRPPAGKPRSGGTPVPKPKPKPKNAEAAEKPAEQTSAEQKPAEQKLVEQKPVEQTSEKLPTAVATESAPEASAATADVSTEGSADA